jgi:hypothetical protein
MKFAFTLILAIAGFVITTSSALADTYTCVPNGAADFSNRIHIRCSTFNGPIGYFALSTADPNRAARVLGLAAGAVLTGQTLDINYDPSDLSGSALGCGTADCRLITWVQLH